MRYWSIVQDGPGVFGEELHGGARPCQHHQVDSQVAIGSRADWSQEHRDFSHGELRKDHRE